MWSWTQDFAPGLPERLLLQSFRLDRRIAARLDFCFRDKRLRFSHNVKLHAQLILHLHSPAANADRFDSEVLLFELG